METPTYICLKDHGNPQNLNGWLSFSEPLAICMPHFQTETYGFVWTYWSRGTIESLKFIFFEQHIFFIKWQFIQGAPFSDKPIHILWGKWPFVGCVHGNSLFRQYAWLSYDVNGDKSTKGGAHRFLGIMRAVFRHPDIPKRDTIISTSQDMYTKYT